MYCANLHEILFRSLVTKRKITSEDKKFKKNKIHIFVYVYVTTSNNFKLENKFIYV